MPFVALLVLVLVPIVEIVVAVVVAHVIGWWLTLGALALCSALGVWQVKVQGLGAWRRCRTDVANGELPARSLLDGALRLIGSFLLVVPGFATGVLALPLLLSPTRKLVTSRASKWTVHRLRVPLGVVSTVGRVSRAQSSRRRETIVDVEGWEDPVRPESGSTSELPTSPDSRR